MGTQHSFVSYINLRAGLRVRLALQRAECTAEPGTWVPRGQVSLCDPRTLLGSQWLCPHLAPTPGWAAPTPYSILWVLAYARLGKHILRQQ